MSSTTSTRCSQALICSAICSSHFTRLAIGVADLRALGRAENLIAYTFNNLSYSSNSYMQALSVLSVIFLPLTFLSVSWLGCTRSERTSLTLASSAGILWHELREVPSCSRRWGVV